MSDGVLLTLESVPQHCLQGLAEGYKVTMAISDGLGTGLQPMQHSCTCGGGGGGGGGGGEGGFMAALFPVFDCLQYAPPYLHTVSDPRLA